MNETLLTWIVFILAFGGMVLIHEFGHYMAARMSGIEVDEFGVGLPTPGAITLWVNKGYMLLKNGMRIEIPSNFRLPLIHSSEFTARPVRLTVDQVDEHLVLRSIEVTKIEELRSSVTGPLNTNQVYVDATGQVVTKEQPVTTQTRVFKAGKRQGAIVLNEKIVEMHPGTRFTFNWLPLGGFVRPKGENDPNVPGGLAAASPWKRLFVLISGPMMNLLAAVVIYAIIFYQVGVPDTSRVLVDSITPESPAAAAGFKSGDIFISGNGQPIGSYDQLRVIVDENANKPVLFLVERDGRQVELTATPQMNETEKRVMIGVGLSVPFRQTSSPAETLGLGARYTGYTIRALISMPAQLIRGTLSPEQSRIIGLKGIFDILEQTVSRDVQASNDNTAPDPGSGSAPAPTGPVNQPIRTLELLASLTISLGVFNLFPIPALDGGRIIFILPELIFRRRVSPQIENVVHGMGMALLLIFMLYVNLMDFINPVTVTIP